MKKHTHWEVLGFKELKDNLYTFSTQVEVLDAENESDAIERAKKLVTKEQYALRRVWECRTCTLNEEAAARQRYTQTMLGKMLDDHNHED